MKQDINKDDFNRAIDMLVELRIKNDNLIDNNRELLDIVKGLAVIFYKELQDKRMPDEITPMCPIIKAAIDKNKNAKEINKD